MTIYYSPIALEGTKFKGVKLPAQADETHEKLFSLALVTKPRGFSTADQKCLQNFSFCTRSKIVHSCSFLSIACDLKLKTLKLDGCGPVLTGDTGQLEYLDYRARQNKLPGYLKSIKFERLSTICFESIGILLQFLSDLRTSQLSAPLLSQIRLRPCVWLEQLNHLADRLDELNSDPRTQHIQFVFAEKPIASRDELRQIAEKVSSISDDFTVLGDDLLSLLNANSDLNFLISSFRSVCLGKDPELNEEAIKKLHQIHRLSLMHPHRASFKELKLWAKICGLLLFLGLSGQKVTEQGLKMLSKHLLNLERIKINDCRYETLKPLVNFKRLQYVLLNFIPPKDELTAIFWSQTLKCVQILLKFGITVLRRTTAMPNMYRIEVKGYIRFPACQSFEFDSLNAMIEYYFND